MGKRDHQALIQNLLWRQKKSYETLRGHERRVENQSAHEIPETLNTERYLENEDGASDKDEKDYKHPGSLELGRRRRKSHSRRYLMCCRVTNIARREIHEGPSKARVRRFMLRRFHPPRSTPVDRTPPFEPNTLVQTANTAQHLGVSHTAVCVDDFFICFSHEERKAERGEKRMVHRWDSVIPCHLDSGFVGQGFRPFNLKGREGFSVDYFAAMSLRSAGTIIGVSLVGVGVHNLGPKSPSTNWLFQLYEKLEEQGANSPERGA
ncbi:hypothetical protein U1Q18_000448 [Sarracenia purpurea var. burkii]